MPIIMPICVLSQCSGYWRKQTAKNQVKMWSSNFGKFGRPMNLYIMGAGLFGVMDGLRYLPGDADGDGVDQGSENFTQLSMAEKLWDLRFLFTCQL